MSSYIIYSGKCQLRYLMTPTACSRTFSRHRLWLLRFSSPRYLFKRPCLFKRNCFRIFWPENHPMHCSPFKNTSTNCSSSLYKRGLQKPFRGNQTWKIGHSIFYKQSWRKSKYKEIVANEVYDFLINSFLMLPFKRDTHH